MIKNYTRATLLASALSLTGLSVANTAISGITYTKMGAGLEVIIHGENLKAPKTTLAPDGKSYLLEFEAAYLGPKGQMDVSQLGLKSIDVLATTKKSLAKIRLNYAGAYQTVVEKRTDGIAIYIGNTQRPTIKTPAQVELERVRKLADAIWVDGQNSPLAQYENLRVHTSTGIPSRATRPTIREPRVALDFVNTDVVLILKALAMQTKVNVITSPKVVGKVSVKIDNLTVKEALNLITSLSGLRYADVKGSYIVTTREDFMETFKLVGGTTEETSETRVVPIYSGQGNQIKAAVLKTVSQDEMLGRFELLLPSEKIAVTQQQMVSTDPGKAKSEGAGGPQGTALEVKSAEDSARSGLDKGSDPYIVVVGPESRADEIEKIIKKLDGQICVAVGTPIPTSTSVISKTYSVTGGKARDLIKALTNDERKTNVGQVELFATPADSTSKQAIVLKGREDAVADILAALTQLDTSEGTAEMTFEMIEIRYADPRSVRELLVSNVPGLAVTLAPGSAGNQRLYQRMQLTTQAGERGSVNAAPQDARLAQNPQGGAGAQGAAGGQAGGPQNDVKSSGSQATDTGTVLPFGEFERGADPMKVVVRGTKAQIDNAKAYVKLVDIAPKQVALELRVMEVDREDLLRVGLDWNLLTGGAVKFIRLNNSQSSPNNTIATGVQGRSVSGDVTSTLDSIMTKSNLISKPNILGIDGRESELFVGDVVRYVESILSSQNGPSVTTGSLRVGVRLSVLPRVGSSGNITMDLRPVVSFLKGFETIPQIGGRLPQTSERVAQSTISMASGETIAIGGLIQEQDRLIYSGLPILKDLPIVGSLFRRTNRDKVKTDLVLFLTAKVVDSPVDGNTPELPLMKSTENTFEKGDLPANRKPAEKKTKGGGKR